MSASIGIEPDAEADAAPFGDGNVKVSARTGVPVCNTVRYFLDSEDYEEREKGMNFIRKMMAILVLVYATILLIASPFCLIDSFRRDVGHVRPYLSAVTFLALITSIGFIITKGKRNARWAVTSLCSCTVCVGVGIGLKLSAVPWADYGLIALGQTATTFALLHAILQFDTKSLDWLNYVSATLLCLVVSGLWIVVMREVGSSWLVATLVALGGWLYAMNIIRLIRKLSYHRDPQDYLRSAIMVLGPPIPDRFIAKEYVPLDDDDDVNQRGNANYGGVESST